MTNVVGIDTNSRFLNSSLKPDGSIEPNVRSHVNWVEESELDNGDNRTEHSKPGLQCIVIPFHGV